MDKGSFVNYFDLLLKLFIKGKKKAVVFDLASIGELQFFQDVLVKLQNTHPDWIIIIAHHENNIEKFNYELPALKNKVIHIPFEWLRLGTLSNIDLFITTEQYTLGLNGVYSICLFHGPSSKGVSFTPEIINSFDAFFMISPLHKQTLKEYLEHKKLIKPNHLEIYDVGYPKSDKLLNGQYDFNNTISKLGLDSKKKTILYAPAFNEYASLRENGIEIIESLCKQDKFNIIAKLPIDCLQPTTNWYSTGGINWFNELKKLKKRFNNFYLYEGLKIDEVLNISEILITCVSSVGFEFLALNRPVIFIDSPKFFQNIKKTFPHADPENWEKRSTVNGGREFGKVVYEIDDLTYAIEDVMANYNKYPKNKKKLAKQIIFNRGKGTDTAVRLIDEILIKKRQTGRRPKKFIFVRFIINKIIYIFLSKIRRLVDHLLAVKGFHIERTGLGYISAAETISFAKKNKLSLVEYLESKHSDPNRIGRRNRIHEQITNHVSFSSNISVCEIGTGTGMYLERIINSFLINKYEVYETARDWVKYLKDSYSKMNFELLLHPADGQSLRYTKDESIELLHSHAVFVYLPVLKTFDYLVESVRVTKPNGYMVFDVITDKEFNLKLLQQWINSEHRFPTVIPYNLLIDFFKLNNLKIITEFTELYGPAYCRYFIIQKGNND